MVLLGELNSMPIDRVQCGDCLKFRIVSMMQPEYENDCVRWWKCKICGHRGPAVGRERLYTRKDFEGDSDAHTGLASGLGTGKGVKRSAE